MFDPVADALDKSRHVLGADVLGTAFGNDGQSRVSRLLGPDVVTLESWLGPLKQRCDDLVRRQMQSHLVQRLGGYGARFVRFDLIVFILFFVFLVRFRHQNKERLEYWAD